MRDTGLQGRLFTRGVTGLADRPGRCVDANHGGVGCGLIIGVSPGYLRPDGSGDGRDDGGWIGVGSIFRLPAQTIPYGFSGRHALHIVLH